MHNKRSKTSSVSSTLRRAHGVAKAAKCAVEMLETRVLLSVNVTSYHYDLAETGANTNETILTPSNVNVSTFGKIASLPTDGQVYAQPLVMTGVSMPGGGTEDLVFIATENDSVYAFNAEGTSTTTVWKTSLLQTGEQPIPSGTTGSANIAPIIGITGTPIIDPNTNTMYVVGNFQESNGTYQQRLYALNIGSGATVDGGPVVISATVNGTGNGSSGGKLSFNPLIENQRTALTLANGQVYIAFSSHGDQNNYHGWVMAYNDTTLAQDYVWCTTPNGAQGGIWMSGGGLAVDSNGDLYLTSGNGSFGPSSSNYAMAFAKLSPSLSVLDYFSPYNEATLSSQDNDYGCGNAVLLPTQTGTAPNEALTAGKWGAIFLNNTDTGKMGEINNPPSGPNNDLGEANTGGTQHNTFSYWNGTMYIGADGEKLKAFSVGNGTLGTTPTSQSTLVFGAVGGNGQGCSPTESSSGTSNGIVWVIDNNAYNGSYSANATAIVMAYNANNLGQVLWTSNQAANGADVPGTAIQFTTPVVANGFVYVGTGTGLAIYGNHPYVPPPPPPPPPPPIPAGAIAGFTKFTLNAGGSNPAGVPAISSDSNTLTMTTNVGSEAGSAIYNTPVGYQNFTAEFTYSDTQGNPPADGIAFMLENDSRGTKALGGAGGSLGYAGITPSFAVELNVYQGSSTGDATNGGTRLNNQSTGSVNLSSGDRINVVLSYQSSTQALRESLVDTVTGDFYSTSYTGINLSSILGSNTAYIGFTGGTGGAESLQTISNFGYFAAPLVTGVAPSSGPSTGGTSVAINGTSFTGATAVDFGSTPATSFTVNNDDSITAVSPAGAANVDVTVVTPTATSIPNSADQFTYAPALVGSPIINGTNSALAGVQRSMVDSIVYTFNQAVALAATNAFSIALNSTFASGTLPTLTWTAINPNADGSSTQWDVTFSGAGVLNGSIADGVYDITLNGASVTSDANPTVTATSRTDTFYRLFGDAAGTGSVTGADYNALLSTFNLKTTAAGYLGYFNEDGASKIDAPNYNAFLANFGKRFKNVTSMMTI
jgi:hypothetical protein